MLTPSQWEAYRKAVARLAALEARLERGVGAIPPSRSWDNVDTEVEMERTVLS